MGKRVLAEEEIKEIESSASDLQKLMAVLEKERKRTELELRAKKEEVRKTGDKKQIEIMRKKIHALKRQTRG